MTTGAVRVRHARVGKAKRIAAVATTMAAVLGVAATPALAQTGRMSVIYDVAASIATMVDHTGGPDPARLNRGFDNVYQQGYATARAVPGGLVAKVTTGTPSIRTPNIVGMSAPAIAALLEHIIDARRTKQLATNWSWNASHLVFVDEIGGAERGANGSALAAALGILNKKRARWRLPGGGTGTYARHVHVYVRAVQSMIAFPAGWAPIWRALPLTGGVWLEAYNGNTLPLSAWTPEEWLAWPRAFATQFGGLGGRMNRLHFLVTGSRVGGQDQASQWAWARTGATPADRQSNCTILANGMGGYRLSASPREVEAGSPPGTVVSAAVAFVAEFRRTFPLTGVMPAPGTSGGCTPTPVLSESVAAALGGSNPQAPGLLSLARFGVGLGSGTISTGQVTFDQTTAITLRLPGGADPLGLAGLLAGAGAPGATAPAAFWAAAHPRLVASGAGVGGGSAAFTRGADGSYAATLPVTPTAYGAISFALVIDGQAIRAALGPPADLAVSLAPYAGGLGPTLRAIVDNPMTWQLAIPVGPTGQPLGGLVTAIYPVPAISPWPPPVVPSQNPDTWVRLTGHGFASQTSVTWNGVRLRTAADSPTRERVLVPTALLAAEGTAQLVATNPSPGGGSSAPVTATIGPPAAAVMRVRPRIAGPPRLGAALGCAPGTWSLPVTGFAFVWQRDGRAIVGATDQSHRVVRADLGHRLACVVTATRFGAVAHAVSPGVRPTPAFNLRVVAHAGIMRTIAVVDRLPWRRADVLLEVDRGNGFRVVHSQVLTTGRDTLRVPIPPGRVVLELVVRAHGQELTSLPLAVRLR
jgi:hypothetical protein